MFKNDFYKEKEYHLTFYLLNNDAIEAILAERISSAVEITAIKIFSDNKIIIDCKPQLKFASTVENSYRQLKELFIDSQQVHELAPIKYQEQFLLLIKFASSNFSNNLMWEHADAILKSFE